MHYQANDSKENLSTIKWQNKKSRSQNVNEGGTITRRQHGEELTISGRKF